MKKVIFFILFILSFRAFCQSNENIEKDLIVRYRYTINCIDSTSAYPYDAVGNARAERWGNGYDSVANGNLEFNKRLLYYTGSYPSTLSYSFNGLRNFDYSPLHIVTSADGKLRIYSWDNNSGGTMRFYDNVYQYQSGSIVASCELPEMNADSVDAESEEYDTIYTLSTSKKKIYLAKFYDRESSRDRVEGIRAFCIEKDGKLDDTLKLFKTDTSINNWIAYYYDLFATVDSMVNENTTIYYNNIKNSVYVPIVIKGADGELNSLSHNYKEYHFNGSYFVAVKRE